jgi:hypothetical protein
MQMIYSRKYLDYMLDREAIHEPGKVFTYSTGDPMLMSGVIANATGMSALEFAEKNLFQPIGISSVRWDSDSEGYTATFSMLHLTVRDYAKFGYLYLNKGKWEDKQIVSEEWVSKSTRTDPSVRMWDAYGYLWHVNLPLRLNAKNSNIPADGYMAEGILGQNIIVIPSKDLVIVRVANEQGERMDLVKFLTMVLDTIDEDNTNLKTTMMIESLTPEGWELYDKVMQFTPENLYQQIDGRAEYYLAYDVMGLTFAGFDKDDDAGIFIDLSIYDMGTPTNAFGVFSGERPLDAPRLKLGRDAYRIGANHYILQGQYYIQIIAAEDTDELRKVCMDLAEKVTDFLQDSGQPVWGMAALPEKDKIPQSEKYFMVDALGLDFMRNTYTAKYYRGESIVSVLLSQQDSPESARETLAKFKEHAKIYGKGVDILSVDGIELVSCDMDGSYDVIFQKDRLVAGVTEVKDKVLAIESAINLWKQLQTE